MWHWFSRLGMVAIGLSVGAIGDPGWQGTVAQGPPGIVSQNLTRLTATRVRRALDDMLIAVKQKNVDGVMQYLAQDVAIEVNVESPLGNERLTPSWQEYRQSLETGFGVTKNYQGRYSNVSVKVATDGKSAIATYVLTEETAMTQPSVQVQSVSNETVEFVIREGKLMASSLKSQARLTFK